MKIMSLIAFALLFSAPLVNADTCGKGKITRVLEGGWNLDHFMIQIDYSAGASAHPGTEYSGFIVYKTTTLSPARLNGIRSMALAAYFAGKVVQPYTANSSCGDATELQLF